MQLVVIACSYLYLSEQLHSSLLVVYRSELKQKDEQEAWVQLQTNYEERLWREPSTTFWWTFTEKESTANWLQKVWLTVVVVLVVVVLNYYWLLFVIYDCKTL